MQSDLGRPLEGLNVDGGASANNLLMQFQSDVLGVKLKRPKYVETTSLGAIFAAGLGAGIWNDLSAVEKTWKIDREFSPTIDPVARGREIGRWKAAVGKTLYRGT
jgi:glycerol kinase